MFCLCRYFVFFFLILGINSENLSSNNTQLNTEEEKTQDPYWKFINALNQYLNERNHSAISKRSTSEPFITISQTPASEKIESAKQFEQNDKNITSGLVHAVEDKHVASNANSIKSELFFTLIVATVCFGNLLNLGI